jgi:hypothetical protein
VVSRQIVKEGKETEFEDYVRWVANEAHKFPGKFAKKNKKKASRRCGAPRSIALWLYHSGGTMIEVAPLLSRRARAPPHQPHQAGGQLARVPYHLPLQQQGEFGALAQLFPQAQVRRVPNGTIVLLLSFLFSGIVCFRLRLRMLPPLSIRPQSHETSANAD